MPTRSRVHAPRCSPRQRADPSRSRARVEPRRARVPCPRAARAYTCAPDAFSKRFKRGGQLSCFDDAALREAAKATGRKKMILAGLTTDICLFWAARSALELGFDVIVVADACGTMASLGDQVTFDRLRAMGATVTVTNQKVTELVDNFGTPEGQKAQTIMADEIISKLGK